MSGAAVTPTGVREGDPAALAALCAVRGPSVLAYCRHVAGEADAGAAAADAFARFRAAVVAAGAASPVNPESLLINATRKAAASRAGRGAEGVCAEVPGLLAARAERTIAIGDLERLEAHLTECWACRAPVARFKAAERAYRDPAEKTIDPAIAAQIIAALAAAVPPAVAEPAAAPAGNGSGPGAQAGEAGAPAADATQAFAIADGTAVPGTADASEPAPEAGAGATVPGTPAAKRKRSPVASRLSSLLASRSRSKATPTTAPASTPARPAAKARATRTRPAAAARSGGGRWRGALRMSILLPVLVVVIALLIALLVSGVVNGNDPDPSPKVSKPAATPPAETAAPVGAVPGAEAASAKDVELAKARDRLRAARKRAAARKRSGSAIPATGQAVRTPPIAPPARAPAPPAAQADPPPAAAKPAPKRKPAAPKPDRTPPEAIETGNGLTDADSIPLAPDPSVVPDLTPPGP